MALIKTNRLFHLMTILISVMFIVSFFPGSCLADKVKRQKDLNILLLTIDTLRADRVGYSGYDIETPHLDSLAFGGTAFLNAVCQVPLTLPSHASILTGTNPPFHGIKNNGEYVNTDMTTLAEILSQNGYVPAAFIGAFPLDSQFGLDQGFEIYDDDYNTPKFLQPHGPQRLAEAVFSSAAQWIRENHKKKFFVWAHYYDPHDPYLPPSPFDQKYKDRLYDGEIAYTDVYVGELIALLNAANILQNTLVVIVGDHGEDLYEHNEPGHGIFVYDTTLKVPLIFNCPGIIPEENHISQQVRTIDIMPTILDIVKIDIPKFVQGKSLIPLIQGKKLSLESYAETYFPLITHGWSELKAIRTDEWKYIQAPKPELYNLKDDPGELKNVLDANGRVARHIKKKLEDLEKKASLSQKPAAKQLSSEAREKLMALGYVAGSIPDDTRNRPDPKDMVAIIKDISQGLYSFRQGRLKDAERILSEIRKKDPRNPLVLRMMGNIYQKREEWDKAIEVLEEAVKANSMDVESYHLLVISYVGNNDNDKAMDIARIVLDIQPNHLPSLLFLASAHSTMNQTKEALDYLERALDVDPSNLEIRLEYARTLTRHQDYEKAAEFLNEMIEQEPTFDLSYLALSNLYEKTKQWDKAIKVLENAVATEIKNADILNKLAQYLQRTGQFERSIEILRMVIERDPEDKGALNYQGIYYWHSGQHDKAIDLFNKVISLDDKNASAHNNLGSVYLEMNKSDLARTQFEKAIKHDPTLGGPYNGLGVIYAREGKMELAVENWRKAVENDDEQFDAMFNLGILLTQMNRFQEALKYLEQFVNNAPQDKYAKDKEKVKELIARIKRAIR
ncbi:MAG: sulfatase-like hydrolase/transferase [Candidatus Aminicenantes bacterium]|nr:sulfatase-like hydrolase/transferase [Candidatus Aminicenantes bacterium]